MVPFTMKSLMMGPFALNFFQGENNPLDEFEFHDLSLQSRMWIMKALCEVALVSLIAIGHSKNKIVM